MALTPQQKLALSMIEHLAAGYSWEDAEYRANAKGVRAGKYGRIGERAAWRLMHLDRDWEDPPSGWWAEGSIDRLTPEESWNQWKAIADHFHRQSVAHLSDDEREAAGAQWKATFLATWPEDRDCRPECKWYHRERARTGESPNALPDEFELTVPVQTAAE